MEGYSFAESWCEAARQFNTNRYTLIQGGAVGRSPTEMTPMSQAAQMRLNRFLGAWKSGGSDRALLKAHGRIFRHDYSNRSRLDYVNGNSDGLVGAARDGALPLAFPF
jgi:hypothetical protein